MALTGAVALALSSGAVTVTSGSASAAVATGTGTGVLSTDGNRIVDENGDTVVLTGLNWFGMETDNKTFHGLWSQQPWRSQIDQMADLGYNTIRVPYSNDALEPDAVATSINTATNADLVGDTPLEILDKVVDYAGSKGMRILLDRHRPESGGQSALWYTASTPESEWIEDWQLLAERYAGTPTVIGADLHNEPHAEGTLPAATGACWGCGDPDRDWRLAAERAGNAIHDVNPDWLIVVEGVSCPSGGLPDVYDGDPTNDELCGWWGGNLSKVADFPVRLDQPGKLVYSPHDYATSVFEQDWFNAPDFPANLPGIWDHFWGYIHADGIAPVLLGEFGTTLADPRDRVWLEDLMAYLGTGEDAMSFTYWSWNPNSGDTGGIVKDDWTTVEQGKQDILAPYLVPPVPPGGSPGPTPTSTPTGTPTPTTTGPSPTTPAGRCTATFAVVNTWPDGFQGEVVVAAERGSVAGWTLTWPAEGVEITNSWGAQVTVSAGTVTALSEPWNGSLSGSQTATVGFTADGEPPGQLAVACATG